MSYDRRYKVWDGFSQHQEKHPDSKQYMEYKPSGSSGESFPVLKPDISHYNSNNNIAYKKT